MKAKFERVSRIAPSFRVSQVSGMFDIQNQSEVRHSWSVDLPIEDKEWLIGAVVGASGSGKSVLAQELFKNAHLHKTSDWPLDKSVLDGFDEKLSAKDITNALSSVGFSSPPYWLKPYAHLSNGQKFRCELTRSILSDRSPIIFDEFTSVVDRDVAKVCCAAVSKFIRRRKSPQFIALSCHYDILDWLAPDWIYDVSAERFECGRIWRRSKIELQIYQVSTDAWRLFRGHHYLSHDLNKTSTCYCAFWNDRPTAFAAILAFPHAQIKNARREHRVVVLPDFQGVGIGNRLSEFLGDFYTRNGYRYFGTTSHPSMISHRQKKTCWKLTRAIGHTLSPGTTTSATTSQFVAARRLTASFEYVRVKGGGDAYVVSTNIGPCDTVGNPIRHSSAGRDACAR